MIVVLLLIKGRKMIRKQRKNRERLSLTLPSVIVLELKNLAKKHDRNISREVERILKDAFLNEEKETCEH